MWFKMESKDIVLTDCRQLGWGAYGKVYMGKFGGKCYAVKRRYITLGADIPPGCIHLNEVDIMCSVKHDYILHADIIQKQSPIPDSFLSDSKTTSGENIGVKYRADLVYLLCECLDGDLSDISSENSAQAIEIIYQILLGIQHLHSLNFIHRDIKPNNVLYTHDGDDIRIKICDFDMCLPDIYGMESFKAMTPEYTPPEVLLQGADVMYTKKVDVWGAGLTLYYIIMGCNLIRRGGRPPGDLDQYILAQHRAIFPGGHEMISINACGPNTNIMSTDDIASSIKTGHREIDDLLTHMLECDPEKRWDAHQCLNHPIFGSRPLPAPRPEPDHELKVHFLTEEMGKVFDDAITTTSTRKMYGLFLGLDILMRIMSKQASWSSERDLAICCYNMGIKFFDKETASCIPLDVATTNKYEYAIVAMHLKGRIYRDTIYNHVHNHHERIYKYLMDRRIYPVKFSVLLRAVQATL